MRQKQPATQPQLYWNMSILSTTCTHLECMNAHAQTLKWRGSEALKGEFRFECAANERRFEHSKQVLIGMMVNLHKS